MPWIMYALVAWLLGSAAVAWAWNRYFANVKARGAHEDPWGLGPSSN